MSYIDGLVFAIPTANRSEFIGYAKRSDSFLEGYTRIVYGWEDELLEGQLTDFRKSVQAKTDESIVFVWVEWPDKATRNFEHRNMQTRLETEANFINEIPPFNGRRMISGGFETIIDFETTTHNKKKDITMSYIDGFLFAVKSENKEAFIDYANRANSLIEGCTRVVYALEDDLQDGQVTDFRKAVQAKDDEAVVFGWEEWLDKEARNKGHELMAERMESHETLSKEMPPFDELRMVFGGFETINEIS